MVSVPSFSTPETERLCKEIAKKSKGVCFLGFSGGKDSLAALLYLRKFFDKIYAFHCATVPGYKYREDYLRYIEDEFGIRILRMMDASLSSDLIQGIYQLPSDMEFIAEQGWHRFDKLELVEYLRTTFCLPRAWCAFAIQACDSQDRRIQCVQYKGRHDSNKTFYPCWDWPHGELIRAVAESGIELSSEYRYTSRTIEGTPSATHTRILRDHYPADYRRLKAFYPLVDAKDYRERLNARVRDELKAERIRAGGAAAAGSGTQVAEAGAMGPSLAEDPAAGSAAGAGDDGDRPTKMGQNEKRPLNMVQKRTSDKGRKASRKGRKENPASDREEDWRPSDADLERKAEHLMETGRFRAWEAAAKEDPQFFRTLWAEMKDRPPVPCKNEGGFDFFEGEEMDRLIEYRWVEEMAKQEAAKASREVTEAETGESLFGDGEGVGRGSDEHETLF